MKATLLTVDIRYEQDVVLTRQRARHVAALLGFSNQDQTALATAVSEVARNAHHYAGGGRVAFHVTDEPARDDAPALPMLLVQVSDKGPGIKNLDEVLAGRYRSTTGMGLGILGSKRLSDYFDIRSASGEGGERGTRVELGKYFPQRPARLDAQWVARIAADLSRQLPRGPIEELQQQNKELLVALESLQDRNSVIERLNAELDETNRGVLALYAELDDKAESLRRASELKSRFLSDLSHELRTPLNAIVSLTGLLLDHMDGPLTAEQDKQVRFIRQSGESLTEMVNDLLDLARIESGKTDLRPSEFRAADVLGALRGMFRPLVNPDRLTLNIAEPGEEIALCSDEAKLSQILRNFISNALKFTERGEVRVWVERVDADRARFSVADIGIAPADHARVFEDFAQLDSPVQRRVRGTGLGLPLTRKLASLLGGEIALVSAIGKGSTFSVTIPLNCPHGTTMGSSQSQSPGSTIAETAGARGHADGGTVPVG
jgi:signal transduction histidine kinase